MLIWAEAFAEEETELQNQSPDVEVRTTREPLPSSEVSVPDGAVVSIRTHSRPGAWCEASVGVVSRSTGYDHLIEHDYRQPTAYLPEYASEAVAEHNLLIALALIRKLPLEMKAMKRFERDGLSGLELGSLTVGILGTGSIGRRTAQKLGPLAETLVGYDLEPDFQWSDQTELTYVDSLDELLDLAQLLVVCLPLNSSTHGLLRQEHWAQLGPDGYLVNCGRGEVTPAEGLLEGLEKNDLAGVGLDVYPGEARLREYLRNPDSTEDPPAVQLVDHERVLTTPHNAFNTAQATRRKVRQALKVVRTLRRKGTVPAQNQVPEPERT